MTAEDCERVCRLAADRGLAGACVRRLDFERATDGWASETGGSVESAGMGAMQ